MGKNKIDTGPLPEFKADPRFGGGIDTLMNLGNRLTRFDFTGDLAPLAQTIEMDPDITKLALDQARAELGPAFEDSINQIKQEAAAANQYESSTFGDALAREAGRLNQQYQGIVSGAALEDRSRALTNRIGLFETGSGLIESGTALAGNNQQQINDFNLRNYENQVAKAVAEKSDRGGIFGGLTGAAGGAMAGSVFGPVGAVVGGVAGGLAGGLGPAGGGGQILNAGAGLYGYTKAAPRSSAGNTSDLFGGVNTGSANSDKLLRQLELFGGLNLN